MDEKDLENYNPIDMECSCCDDDDTFVIKSGSKDEVTTGNDGRDVQRVTGIIIDLSDDDDCGSKKKPMRVISADIDQNNNLQINKNFDSFGGDEGSHSCDIDMECNSCEDDDDDFGTVVAKKSSSFLDFGDDEEYDEDETAFENKEFIDEDMILEKKTTTTQGKVEKDYWDKLQKKHKESNKKGAYNWNFHIGGDPEKEMHMFNHDMGVETAPEIKGSLAGEGMDLSGAPAASSTGATSVGFSSTGGSAAGGEGGGMGESLEEDLDRIFDRIGFEVIPNSDGSFLAMDKCDNNPDVEGIDIQDLIINLKPYIDQCIIIPLQIETGEDFNDFNEWIEWYTAENEKAYPNCKQDIYCCKELADLMCKNRQ